MTLSSIKTVGVIGTGVIGASWTALFLAKGLRVIVTDPAPGAESRLHEYLKKNYSAIPNKIATPDKYLQNLTFVEDIDPYLGELDLIQEVSKWHGRKV
jgi:3-hydroxyacyl-CoA dehydrogenase